MAATLSVRVQTGSSTGSESPAVTGIDLISADNSTNTLANRQANPITIPAATPTSAYSYEKYCKLKVDVAPANGVTNFKAWSAQGGAGGAGTAVTLNAEGAVSSYAQGVTTKRGSAAPIPTTQGGALTWDSASYTTIGNVTKYLVLQLEAGNPASPGNVAQITLNYSYDET